jgi:hypothetical protein
MINMYEKYDDVLVGSPLLVVRDDARVKSSRSKYVHQLRALHFLYTMMCV